MWQKEKEDVADCADTFVSLPGDMSVWNVVTAFSTALQAVNVSLCVLCALLVVFFQYCFAGGKCMIKRIDRCLVSC